jgi:hypothetical protein
MIINFYVRMYVYCPISPHDGITTGTVLILFFSPVNANFIFFGIIIIYYHYIDCLILYFVF